MADKHDRSMVKAFSWRATGTADTIPIWFWISGQAQWPFGIGLGELSTKVFVDRRSLGRVKGPEDFDLRVAPVAPRARRVQNFINPRTQDQTT